MTTTYSITGLTCGNCKATVEKRLSALADVTEVTANITASSVDITAEKDINITTLNAALPDKYNISVQQQTENVFKNSSSATSTNPSKTAKKSKLKQLQPLFLILGYILTASILLHYKQWNYTNVMIDFMGLFFIVFSFFKFLDIKGFAQSFTMYDPLAKQWPVYAWIYPFIEAVLGLMLLFRFKLSIAFVVTVIILGITTVGVSKTLLNKQRIQCACLGTALKLPMTEATFIENAIMLIMASLMLI